ncbi:hypothetical protein M011DRAFT_509530 [Sporormia fimetaria CBS 119925]|uniref:Gfd2/YDR514C-like C-terminal domain-containing protein n=1 Tax=Sporormia fimetaria CBS 119925 TaxID=1340428 RepID=A0A6A6VK00_9PLEO|nr:hypothetical protein M011DRAFT_509530 [Sporormia fimetaria CBS 119925]
MEWFEFAPSSITEIGYGVLHGKDLLSCEPDASVQDLLSYLQVYHSRIIETCHLTNKTLAPAAASNFLFGSTCWVRQAEAKTLLEELFTKWTCADGSPAPVIFFGYGLHSDIKELRRQCSIDLLTIPNIVYTLQTTH